jgi:hypothetical protein
LGEEEMMIVGTVQQEEDCSWQDICKSWTEQNEEAGIGVYQVGTCQGANDAATGTETEAIKQPSAGQCKEAGIVGADERAPEPDDLLLEGEEQEYFLELLMRRASPERPQVGQPVDGRDNPNDEAASTKGRKRKRARRRRKRLSGKARWRRELVNKRRERERRARPATRESRQPSTFPITRRPKAEDWLLAIERRRSKHQDHRRPQEGSVPDRRRRMIPEVVLVRRWVIGVPGIWRGEGLGKGLGQGRSVYKQPETEVDGSCHS